MTEKGKGIAPVALKGEGDGTTLFSSLFPLPIRAIVIDLDGTLLHTAPELAEAANRLLRDMARAPVSHELLASDTGNCISWLVNRALTGDLHAEPEAALYERAMPIFEKHYMELLLQSK